MTQRFGTTICAALLLAGVMVETAAAQARGRGLPGGRGPRAAVAQPAQPVHRPPVFVGRPQVPIAGPRIFNGRPFAVARPHARVVIGQPYVGVYSPYLWSAPSYSVPAYAAPAYVAPTYFGPTAYSDPVYSAPAPDAATEQLVHEMQRLSQEIEQLRQQQALAAAPPPAPVPERPPVDIVLVFRDGHRLVIQNYAIVGQTLWVLDEKTSTKIPVSELDLDATQKENAGRGLRFPVLAR